MLTLHWIQTILIATIAGIIVWAIHVKPQKCNTEFPEIQEYRKFIIRRQLILFAEIMRLHLMMVLYSKLDLIKQDPDHGAEEVAKILAGAIQQKTQLLENGDPNINLGGLLRNLKNYWTWLDNQTKEIVFMVHNIAQKSKADMTKDDLIDIVYSTTASWPSELIKIVSKYLKFKLM